MEGGRERGVFVFCQVSVNIIGFPVSEEEGTIGPDRDGS